METQNGKENLVTKVEVAAPNENPGAVLHEQLALKRLRKLKLREKRRKRRAEAALELARRLRPVWKVLVWLFTPVVPVRREGPHLPPVPVHLGDKGDRYLQRFF